MALLLAIFKLSLAVYLAGISWFIIGLFRVPKGRSDDQPTVSVVVSARGACPWLLRLLRQLAGQDYPAQSLQIVVVDDGLEPHIGGQVADLQHEDGRFLMVPSTIGAPELLGKNRALDAGIKKSRGELLLFTDADCQVEPGWVSAMVAAFTAEVDYVVGWSQIVADQPGGESDGAQPWAIFERVDFLMLMLAGRSAVRMGTPWASSGQNQAYRRSLYDAAGGLEGLAGRLQGDDSLFLQLARRRVGARVAFAEGPGAAVMTEPSEGPGHFLRQRLRWAADVLIMLRINPLFFLLPVATFLTNGLLLIMVGLAFISPDAVLPVLIGGLLLKGLFEGLLLGIGARQVGAGHLRRHFPGWFLFQIPYITAMGLGSFWGQRIGWQGRSLIQRVAGGKKAAPGA